MAQKVLSFQSQAAYSGTDKLEVFVMTTADPSTATLSALECHIAEPPATGYSGFGLRARSRWSHSAAWVISASVTLHLPERAATAPTASTMLLQVRAACDLNQEYFSSS